MPTTQHAPLPNPSSQTNRPDPLGRDTASNKPSETQDTTADALKRAAEIPAPSTREAKPLVLDTERKLLYGILSLIITYLLVTTTTHNNHMVNIHKNTEDLIRREATAGKLATEPALLHLESIAAIHIAATNKSTALMLSFLVVILGTLLVVKGVEASYELRLHGATTKSDLVTSSPGLVMITLALGLALGVVLHNSSVTLATYSQQEPPVPQHFAIPPPKVGISDPGKVNPQVPSP